jgi:hypothetical protein
MDIPTLFTSLAMEWLRAAEEATNEELRLCYANRAAKCLELATKERSQANLPYRLYVIDSSGRVIDVYEPECVSDEQAYHKATTVLGEASIDIWQGDRWVAWLDGKDPQRIALARRVESRA